MSRQSLQIPLGMGRLSSSSNTITWSWRRSYHERVVGIAVGLHPGYNAAQRLYAKRGYIPDARGIMYRNRFVEDGASVVLDDDLVMHLTKQLAAG